MLCTTDTVNVTPQWQWGACQTAPPLAAAARRPYGHAPPQLPSRCMADEESPMSHLAVKCTEQQGLPPGDVAPAPVHPARCKPSKHRARVMPAHVLLAHGDQPQHTITLLGGALASWAGLVPTLHTATWSSTRCTDDAHIASPHMICLMAAGCHQSPIRGGCTGLQASLCKHCPTTVVASSWSSATAGTAQTVCAAAYPKIRRKAPRRWATPRAWLERTTPSWAGMTRLQDHGMDRSLEQGPRVDAAEASKRN